MAVAYRDIARVLDGARRREGGLVLATAVGWGATAVLVALLAGAIGLALRPDAHLVRPLSVGVAFVAATGALLWAGLVLRRRAGAPEAIARALGEREPGLRSDLVTAVELEREQADIAASGRFSLALVEEHAARTAARAAALDLRRLLPSRSAKNAWNALALAALATLLALAIGGGAMLDGWRRLAGTAPVARALPRATPITGDVELTYRFPAYMNRGPQTLSGTGGEIRAPKGTEVTLRTRADRDVAEAQVVITGEAAAGVDSKGASEKSVSLTVNPPRALEGAFLVDEAGAYRFRFTKGKKVVAEGPPAAIVVEPDAVPEVRIASPKEDLEVQPGARVAVEWAASDDWGLQDLTLVVKRDGATAEERRRLRELGNLRRDGGVETLDTTALRLGEGDRIQYWLEATDGDTVSGPKKGASSTHVLRIYSAAEHRRAALEKARQLWEAMVGHLGERLEFFEPGRRAWTPQRVTQARAMDGRTRALSDRFATGVQELRADRASPRPLVLALANVGAQLAQSERDLGQLREALARTLSFQRDDGPLLRRVEELDDRLDDALERGVLYLEQLLDQERADDLVRMARELQQKRRDLASLAEKVKDAPTAEGKKQLLAEVQALRKRMQELARRMAELAKGMNDEHMNAEALAELERSQDAESRLDAIEEALAKGDLDGAMKALDELGARMDELVAGMERTARRPGEQNRELARELQALKKDLQQVEQEQEALAKETERDKAEYQREVQRRTKDASEKLARLQKRAAEAKRAVEEAEPGVSLRSEAEHEQARERLAELERALAMKDLDLALETARRAVPPVERLAANLEEDAALAERFPQMVERKDPRALRAGRDAAARAVAPAREVKEELERLFPDPRSVLPQEAQARLERQSQRQDELARRASELRERAGELGQKAPIFPPQAQGALRDAQEQMQGAAGELAQRNPQRGHGRQRQALDALGRFREGMEQMARKGGQQGDGEGMPMPFAMQSGGHEEGDGQDPSQEKVEIPGAEAHKPPEQFRRDLMEAMRQGAPDQYRGEVSRYYQEIVK